MNTIAPIIDPVYLVGQHKGKKLSQIPTDYLEWMIRNSKQTGKAFFSGGRDWTSLAAAEIERRVTGAHIDLGMEIDVSEATATPTVEQPTQRHITADDINDVSFEAIDDAAELFLEEFVMRMDKNLSFTKWIVDLAKEAFRVGKRIDGQDKTQLIGTVAGAGANLNVERVGPVFAYMTAYFFYSQTGVVLRITKSRSVV